MKLVFRDPSMNLYYGWYLQFCGRWYRILAIEKKWGIL